MEAIYLKEIVEREYGIDVKSLEKIKNTYKINGSEGYCLKVVNYNYPHFSFILGCIRHLQMNNLDSILDIILNKNNKEYIKIGDKYGYLTRWIRAKESNFDDLVLVEKIGEEVSKMHIKSRGYVIPSRSNPRIYWGSWIRVFETRISEIYDFQNRINQKAFKNSFDKLFLENLKEQIKKGNEAIKGLKDSDYFKITNEQIMKMGFCHHDLENHNILIDKNNDIKFIDFDYCILDSNLHDLASLIWRVNRYSDLNIEEKIKALLKGYERHIEVKENEKEIMRAFLSFPNDFWQRGLQVYWEQQPWGENFMIEKLEQYLKMQSKKEMVIKMI